MDAASFQRVYDSLSGIPRLLCGLLRPASTWRDHSGNYLQGAAGAGPGAAQRRESPESVVPSGALDVVAALSHVQVPVADEPTVLGRLQEYWWPAQAGTDPVVRCGCSMAATSPSLRAGSPAGMARQYCPGRLGAGVANPGWDVPDWSARWADRWWTSACICPDVGPPQGRCAAAGRAGGPAELPVKDGVGPGDAGTGPGVGLPQGRVGCRRRRLRDVADLPGGTGGPGDALRAGRSGLGTTVWPLDPAWTSPEYPTWSLAVGHACPSCGLGSGGPWSSAVMNCRMRLGGR